MKLIITDTLENAKTIAKAVKVKIDYSEIRYFEGNDYIVAFSLGRLFVTYAANKFKLSDDPDCRERFNVIKNLISSLDVDLIINAYPQNKDGDLIFKEIFDAVGVFKPVKRLDLNKIESSLARLDSIPLKASISGLNNKDNNFLGNCPACGKVMVEKDKVFVCTGAKEGCKFKLFKNDRFFGSMGKELTIPIVKGLLSGDSVLVKGLKSKNGKIFNAKIRLVNKSNNYWGYEFEGFES